MPPQSCPPGYFNCDGGVCEEDYKICNGHHDCEDLTDERNCSDGEKKVRESPLDFRGLCYYYYYYIINFILDITYFTITVITITNYY